MKFLNAVAASTLFSSAAQAHYIFSILVVNGVQKGGDYAYVRKNTNNYMPSYTDDIVNSPELRCNAGATNNGKSTQTIDVAPGSKIGFKLFYNEKIEHPGPAMVYMSKAPGKVSDYDGSGDWFKVFESGLCKPGAGTDANWCSWQKDRIEFTLPADTPPGEYLVRPEHIGLHEGHIGKAQFYMECAQIRVTGSGTGTPGPMVKIPGVYSKNDPSIDFNKWTNPAPQTYKIPGPAVWKGGSSGASTGASTTAPVQEQEVTTPETSQGSTGSTGQTGTQLPSWLTALISRLRAGGYIRRVRTRV